MLEPYFALLPSQAADLPLFRTWNATTKSFKPSPLTYSGAYLAITNRIKAAGLPHHFSPHSFRATAITSFITAGGSLERARVLANHSSAETTRIYDKKQRELTADESILLEHALEPSPHN
jgi:integrase/recombinase XerD